MFPRLLLLFSLLIGILITCKKEDKAIPNKAPRVFRASINGFPNYPDLIMNDRYRLEFWLSDDLIVSKYDVYINSLDG